MKCPLTRVERYGQSDGNVEQLGGLYAKACHSYATSRIIHACTQYILPLNFPNRDMVRR